MSEANGLQRLTESTQKVLNKKKILPSDLTPLSAMDRHALQNEINEALNRLKGQELHDYVEKIEEIVPGKTDLKRQQWELNHAEICRVISNTMKEYNRPPTKNEIAKETGLSRQTIYKHLMEFENSEFYAEQSKKLKILNHKLMAKVYQYACNGSVKAARLYFEMNGELGKSKATKNYFIQINTLKVDESIIKALPKNAIEEIEQIIFRSVPEEKLKLTTNGN